MSTLLRSPSPFEPADSLLSSSSIVLEASGIHERAISGALLALPSYVSSGPSAAIPSSGLVQRIRIPLGTGELYNSASNGSCALPGNGERVAACWRAVVRYLSSFVSAGGETAAADGENGGETAAADSAAGDGSGSVSKSGAGGVTYHDPIRNVRFERALWDLQSMTDAVCVPAEEDEDVRVVVGEILGKLTMGDGEDVREVAGEGSEAAAAPVGDFIMVNICDRYIELVPGIVAAGAGEQQEQDVSHCGSGF